MTAETGKVPLKKRGGYLTAAIILGAAALAAGLFYRNEIWQAAGQLYAIISDRQHMQAFIASFGVGAPAIFIILQVLQVVFAPVPGEATGFIGGYLFGTWQGFLYSTVGLTVGSILNFGIGRFLGDRFVRRMIPPDRLAQMDRFVKHQGIIILFILFVFPGFPKDYLCLFLGLSAMPFSVFLLITAVGRMPGTLMLSLQGASLYEKQYSLLAVLMILCLVLAALAYRYREGLYRWVEKRGERRKKP
jgi:uncharacterized membrane protein YdjX (TVP38/TMEM64 family)